MKDIIDVHTHNIEAKNAIINYDPTIDDFIMMHDKYYSVGIHPWNTEKASDDILKYISSLAEANNVLAIGETGIDNIKGGDLQSQIALFKYHVAISEKVKKPIIIHCVKAVDEIIRLKKLLNSTQIWIYHGFRGKPQQAAQLISHGFYLSFGNYYNSESLSLALENNRIFYETD